MKLYLFLTCFTLLIACEGIDEIYERDAHQFQVTVVNNDFCNLILVEFREEDADAVTKITGSSELKYFALNSNKILAHPGQELLTEFRNMNENEWINCPTLLPTYPGIVMLSLEVLS
jgi:hypothetical protein